MELFNKKTQFSVKNEGESFKLTGVVNISETGKISDFNGQFFNLEGNYVGTFYYAESELGKSSKTITDVESDLVAEVGQLLDVTVFDIKNTNN